MKFDAIVGNPPYQEEGNNNNRKQPIYNFFLDVSAQLSNISTLITPGRFLFEAGETPKNWNRKMLNDEHFKVVAYYSKSKDVFPTVDIKGGIVISLYNKNKNFGAIQVFTEMREMNQILHKVISLNAKNALWLNSIISSRGNYRFSNKFFEDFPNASESLGEGTGNMIVSDIFEEIPNAFQAVSINDDYLAIVGREQNRRIVKYIKKEYVLDNPFIDTFNVLITKSNGKGAFGESLSTPLICKKNKFLLILF